MQTTRSMSAQWNRNASTTGERARVCRASSPVKAGVSVTLRRITQPAKITTTLSRNGMRQPQLLNCSAGM